MRQIKWVVDPLFSLISFQLKSCEQQMVTGYFTDVEGFLESNIHDFENAKLSFQVNIRSLSALDEQSSRFLKNMHLFSAGSSQQIQLTEGLMCETNWDDQFYLSGNLTIGNCTRRIILKVTGGKENVDVDGNVRIDFNLCGELDCKDFWVLYTKHDSTDCNNVSCPIKIDCKIELVSFGMERESLHLKATNELAQVKH